jgi:hypothetical protein
MMKKTHHVIIAVALSSLLLVGCSGRNRNNDQDTISKELIKTCSTDLNSDACNDLNSLLEANILELFECTKSENSSERYLAFYYLGLYFSNHLTGAFLTDSLKDENDESVQLIIVRIGIDNHREELVPLLKSKWINAKTKPILRAYATAVFRLGSKEDFADLVKSLDQFSGKDREVRTKYLSEAKVKTYESSYILLAPSS